MKKILSRQIENRRTLQSEGTAYTNVQSRKAAQFAQELEIDQSCPHIIAQKRDESRVEGKGQIEEILCDLLGKLDFIH